MASMALFIKLSTEVLIRIKPRQARCNAFDLNMPLMLCACIYLFLHLNMCVNRWLLSFC